MVREKFLNQLDYWIRRKKYGVENGGKIWIYNTLERWAEQLGVSKRTMQRAIKSLRDEGVIEAAYLSKNRRDRTLFYTINYEKVSSLRNFSSKTAVSLRSENLSKKNDHMADHMAYIDNNNKNLNKSYKSFDMKNLQISDLPSEKVKPTIVQDMLKAFKMAFPNMQTILTKFLARNFVAAFKLKFQNSIVEWKKFLELIKTSSYLMNKKFKLTLHWILKFATIDRLKRGELGVKSEKVSSIITDEEKIARENAVVENIMQLNEDDVCKRKRLDVLQKVGVDKYLKYLSNWKKCRFVFEKGEIFVELLGKKSIEVQDFLENAGLVGRWIDDCYNIRQNGYHYFRNLSSFDELSALTVALS